MKNTLCLTPFFFIIITIFAFSSLNAQDINSAVLKDDTLIIKEALKSGADINGADKYGASPLMTAAR